MDEDVFESDVCFQYQDCKDQGWYLVECKPSKQNKSKSGIGEGEYDEKLVKITRWNSKM
jgi:hypothetical protein